MADEAKKERREREAEQRAAPSGTVVYKAILQEGDSELERSSQALFWSGLAAGMSMSFSLIAEALLRSYLPAAGWRPLIAKLGYSMGFLMVVLGRQQLFTENTLTPVLPLLLRRDRRTLVNMLRLWAIVLVANLIGALLMGLVLGQTAALGAEVHDTAVALGREALSHGPGVTFLRAIFAGWLIALMVWLLPFAEAARVWVIILLTYLVGLGQFPHIIAGAVEVFTATWVEPGLWGYALGGYILPTLIGNIVGGVTLVAAINHAQVTAGGEGEDL